MATITLTDQNISETYSGLLHSQGVLLPTSGQVLMYDGDGNASALRLGRSGQGLSVIGTLSADSLSAAGISYPTTDGTAGQFLQTNGVGKLAFSNVLSSSLPTLSPNPANTYTSLSAITVDSKGRVTEVITSTPGAAESTQSLYVTPILLVDASGSYDADVSVYRSNMPSGTTYAILKIESQIYRTKYYTTNPLYVYINDAKALLMGSELLYGTLGDSIARLDTNETIWYGALDGSDNINIHIDKQTNAPSATRVYLLGYANFNTLSNP